MHFKRFRSRKLLLILAFLFDIYSISNYKIKDFDIPDVKEHSQQTQAHSDVLWVVDDRSGR